MKKDNLLDLLSPYQKNYNADINTISKEFSHAETKRQNVPREPGSKYRYVIVLIGFFIFFLINAYRMNMSVSIVAMVNNSAVTEQTKGKSDSCRNLITNATQDQKRSGDEWEGDFVWSPQIQGYILSSYFFGYIVTQIPAGRLVERFGCKWFLFFASFITAVCTFLIPLFSRLCATALIVLQTVRGLAQGIIQPSVSVLAANWFPKMERGLLYTIIQSGCAMGSFSGSLFSGLLGESLVGWPSSFYAFGAAGMILSISILFFVFESPKVHPKISKTELDFIVCNQENALSRRRPDPPWRKIFKSIPVYALVFGCFGQLWAISQFLIVHSTFLGTILHYKIMQNGLFSAVPFLIQFLGIQASGWLSSYAHKKRFASVDFLRKFWTLMGSLGYSACLLGIYFAGCNRSWSIIFAILSTGFTGFGYSGVWIVSADMSPTFSGTLNAICLAFGCMSSVILPLIVGYLTDEMQTISQWNKVIFISVGVVLSTGILFAIFGSAEVQPWNYAEQNASKDFERNMANDEKNTKNDQIEITHF